MRKVSVHIYVNVMCLEVEWILGSIKVIKSDLEEDPFDEKEHHYSVKRKYSDESEEEEEEERDDREYSWKIYKK